MNSPINQDTSLRAAAITMGQSLCATAYWDAAGRECNWMGHRDMEDALSAPYSKRNAALSPELYSGSAGIGLFLGEVSGVTGDRRVAETACAALRRSARYMQEVPSPVYPLSLYAGHLGLLYVATRLKELHPTLSLENECEWLFEHIRREWRVPHPYDIIGGNAGAIPALLTIGRHFRTEDCQELAVQLGHELCQAAEWSGKACSWQSSGGFSKLPPMTGFSHGASGIAISLLKLHALTGEVRLLQTARGAFAFEDNLYNASEKNWIDTRYPYRRQDDKITGRFRLSWCHGAPGIAMARAVASRLDVERAEHHVQLARSATETTLKALNASATQSDYDATLCHGLAGLSEVLLVVREILGGDEGRDPAEAMLVAMTRRHGSWEDWPSGLQSKGRTPCLMIGAAGIGLHLLRMTSPNGIPSPLLLGWT